MPASIRRVGDDVSVSVSPERLAKKAERTEAEMTEIHRALRELEEAVAEGEPFSYADEVDAQSAEIAECQQFCADVRARIEELSEIQEQANTIRRLTVERAGGGGGGGGGAAPGDGPAPAAERPSDTLTRQERLTARERELLEQELAPLAPLFEAAGVTAQHRTNILNIFRVAGGGEAALDLEAFTDVMVWLHVPREYCRQYFKAFDLDMDGSIDYREFLLGVIAMDNATLHEGMWAEMRARYIFRTYDVNENRQLDLAELTHLVRHLRRGRGDGTRPNEIEAEAIAVMDALCEDEADEEVPFDAFLNALPPFGDTLVGTSVLFRLGTPTSPKDVDITAVPDDEQAESVGRTDSAVSVRSALADRGVDEALHEERVRLDDLRLALRFCQSMSGEERSAFLREFFQEFGTDAGSTDEEGAIGDEDSDAYEIGSYDSGDHVFGGQAESALDLENYNWVADPGPHPGVRGLGTDAVGDPSGAPQDGPHDHTDRVDIVLAEFEEVMDNDPSAVDFLSFLVDELKNVGSRDQQNRVLGAVRNALCAVPDGSGLGVSTGMGIAAELLGTQQGDRLPSRRGRRAKLSGAPAETDLRPPDFRPGSAPSSQSQAAAMRGDPTARPTSADGSRSFVNSSFASARPQPSASETSAANDSARGATWASARAPESSRPASGAYDYVETAESASSVSTVASEDEQALQAEDYAALDSENSAYMEAIQACMDGTHLAAGALDQIPTAEPAGDSSGDQSGYSSESDPGSSTASQMNLLTQEYTNEIRHNEAVGQELNNILTTLIEAGKSLNEVAAQGEDSVTLTTQHLEMVAQRILAVAEGERGTFDSRLREALVAAHLQYAGMDAVAYKDRLVQEVSDMLYDEMIFNKVVQQVEHSYDDDIKAVNERLQPGREISDAQRAELQQLLALRHNDLHRLHQEREKRLSGASRPNGAAPAPAPASMRQAELDTSSQSSDDSDPPIEVFRPGAGSSDGSDGLAGWEDDLQGVTIDDLPQASLLEGVQAVDRVLNMSGARKAELLRMMEREHASQPVGAAGLDRLPS